MSSVTLIPSEIQITATKYVALGVDTYVEVISPNGRYAVFLEKDHKPQSPSTGDEMWERSYPMHRAVAVDMEDNSILDFGMYDFDVATYGLGDISFRWTSDSKHFTLCFPSSFACCARVYHIESNSYTTLTGGFYQCPLAYSETLCDCGPVCISYNQCSAAIVNMSGESVATFNLSLPNRFDDVIIHDDMICLCSTAQDGEDCVHVLNGKMEKLWGISGYSRALFPRHPAIHSHPNVMSILCDSSLVLYDFVSKTIVWSQSGVGFHALSHIPNHFLIHNTSAKRLELHEWDRLTSGGDSMVSS
ncbi:hypothetical protein ADUPG1_007386, partial [Aduncisulcus paluster]